MINFHLQIVSITEIYLKRSIQLRYELQSQSNRVTIPYKFDNR